ncbi:angiopoietin-4 isoform X1 [Equus przewalskii]|uniref:Angiopoietin-4 isoform X1 n=1 Tax=Equus przewalskii TaxID=9798 RepID=A0ABM2F7M3_EQUPR|nr:angiopoietin-4 isoform X2 [Equus caballus]XP_008527441.1 PREDICTED: angiopoietin-4 isoform X2 [Equus przewalskii]
MPSWPAMLLGSLLLMVATVTAAQRRGQEAGGRRRAHRVQHGQCSYTFVLPEPCASEPEAFGGSNSLQRDSPAAATLNLGDWSAQRVRQLEKMLENNTQWLQKLERYIQMSLRSELAQAQRHMVQNQTATMLELGTSLLNQTTAQTRKLTSVEAQVLNQTSRMEIQLLETSLSTNKLEKQLLLQGHELHRLQGQNSALETRVQALETQQQAELASLRGEKERLRRLLGRQSGALAGLERSLRAASSNSSLLQRQQRQLLESVQRLVRVVAQGPASLRAAEQVFQDCAEIQRFGANASGVYTIHVANVTEPRKVFCDMEANGGGWTLIQRRENGSVNFQRNWKDYKQGFGDPAGEHWLGNEVVHQLTSRAAYSLRVELQDWEGNEAYAQYDHFQLGSEGQLYRLSLSGYSGSAGRQSSLVLQGTNFSTRDADNDNCLCKCAQMLSGGVCKGGGLTPAASPTSTASTTQPATTRASSTASAGTTSRAPATRCAPRA